jgi:hypothetical protein
VSKPIDHPRLGQLVRTHGKWSGRCSVPGYGEVPLKLFGDKHSPGPNEVALATEIGVRFQRVRPMIEQALCEHYEPYRTAIDSGGLEVAGEPVPRMAGPNDVWTYATLVAVSVDPLGTDEPIVEFVFETMWDTEHRLGARFSASWEFVELCGSV